MRIREFDARLADAEREMDNADRLRGKLVRVSDGEA